MLKGWTVQQRLLALSTTVTWVLSSNSKRFDILWAIWSHGFKLEDVLLCYYYLFICFMTLKKKTVNRCFALKAAVSELPSYMVLMSPPLITYRVDRDKAIENYGIYLKI